MMLWIIFMHYIGDWALQNDFVAQNKGKYWIIMLSHCVVWTGCVCIALQYFNILSFWKLLFLFVGHWVCDKWKCNNVRYWLPLTEADHKRIEADKHANNLKSHIDKRNLILLYIDQLWHFLQCIVVWIF
jgi:hypothetical protein